MFKHYLTTALRNFRRSPYITTINVLGLALGLACFIAAYGAVAYFQSGDRHFANADRIYAIAQRESSQQDGFDTGMNPNTPSMLAKYIRVDFPELEAVVRATRMPSLATAAKGEAIFVRTAAAEADFLRLFDFKFASGGGKDALRSPHSAILTKETAVRLFGSYDVVGQTLLLSTAVNVTVTGVIDAIPQPSHLGETAVSAFRFEMLLSWDVYRELLQRRAETDPENMPEPDAWGWTSYFTYVLLPKDGSLSLARLNEQLRGFPERHLPPERKSHKYEYRAVSLSDLWIVNVDSGWLGGPGLSAVSTITLLSVLILFTACVNYANLATAQTATRVREIGLRKVTGAKRSSIVAQFMLEAALSVAVAMLIALMLIITLAPALRSLSGIDLADPLQREFTLWGLIAIATISAILAAGGYPAIIASRLRPAHAMRSGRLSGMPSFVPKLLVSVQFGAASLLLIATLVVQAQHRELRERALSGNADLVIAIQNNLKVAKVPFEILRNELLQSPYIESVSAIDARLWGSLNSFALTRTQDASEQVVPPLLYAVASDFFSTFNMSLLAGRAFDASRADDVFPGTIPGAMGELRGERTYNVVIDRRLAAQLGWPVPQNAVGQRIYIPFSRMGNGKADQPLLIIGVVEHKPLNIVTSNANANMFYFVPNAQGFPEVLVRLSPTHIKDGLAAIDATWKKLAPNMPLARQFMDEAFEQGYTSFSRTNALIAGLTALALSISMLGLVGMALFVVMRRRHEIGVRKTIGAKTAQIVMLLLRDFSKPVVMANLVVWPFAYVAIQSYLKIFVHRVPLTPLPFIGSLLGVLCIAWLAVAWQTARAARMNPAVVLRHE